MADYWDRGLVNYPSGLVAAIVLLVRQLAAEGARVVLVTIAAAAREALVSDLTSLIAAITALRPQLAPEVRISKSLKQRLNSRAFEAPPRNRQVKALPGQPDEIQPHRFGRASQTHAAIADAIRHRRRHRQMRVFFVLIAGDGVWRNLMLRQ